MPEQNSRIINKYIPNGLVRDSNASPMLMFLYTADRLKLLSSSVISDPKERAEVLRYLLSQVDGTKEDILHQRGHEDVLHMLDGLVQQKDLNSEERDYAAKLREELARLDADLQSQQQPSIPAANSASPKPISIVEKPHSWRTAEELISAGFVKETLPKVGRSK
ncbi:MAG: hypothetical protein M1561_02650 [Gammaproteobacteria bacterium]|nr:hypothetical protein [Gammaproteobacteria bacterium]